MANVLKEYTGLSRDVRISSKEGKHGPRVKVYVGPVGSATISVSISDSPRVLVGDVSDFSNKELENIFKWIAKNKTILLDYWNTSRADTIKVLNSLERL